MNARSKLELKGWDLDELYTAFGIRFERWTIVVDYADVVTEDGETCKVTIDDVIKYYAHDARNITSGIRTLSKIIGDWRPIDELASQCLEVYKVLSLNRLRRIAKNYGLTPKF